MPRSDDPADARELPESVDIIMGELLSSSKGKLADALHRPEQSEASGPVYRLPFAFGRYTLLRRLGVGGMAEAFLAQTAGPAGYQKTSVVKRMLPHLAADARFVQMFQREAKVAALLTHTNVVQIFELGEIDGIHFIAMEHVDGAPLHQLARTAWRLGKSVPMEVICCAMADAALGLAAAHELKDIDGNPLGVVHRDISPDNLMMNREGVTKILDFGIAKHNNAGERTATGELKGKIPFMPPEQLLGATLDGRADLYSLGVTFYWLVTGQRPFQGAGDMGLMDAICKQPPVPPLNLNPMVPPFISDLIMRLLEKDPAARPQSGSELHDLLSDALPARRGVVVPFVQEILAAPPEADSDVPHTPSFAASPHTDTLRAAWMRRTARGAPAVQRALELAAEDALDAAPTGWARKRIIGVAASVAAAALIGSLAIAGAGKSPAPIAVVPVAPAEQVVPVLAAEVPVVPVVPTAPVVPIEGAPVKETTPSVLIAVQALAPSQIQWLSEGGRVLGSGKGTLKVAAGTKQVIAVDKQSGGRSRVKVQGAIADYGALPRGKIHPRANPYADVFLGRERLGTTPFAPVDVPIGKYVLRFVRGDHEEKRTVDVTAGELVRVIVDFSGR